MGQYVNIQYKEYNYLDFSTLETENVEYVMFVDLGKQERSDDYMHTLDIDGYLVDVYMDDYGQCYDLKYKDLDDKQREWCCGTYNTDYVGEAIAIVRSLQKEKTKRQTC